MTNEKDIEAMGKEVTYENHPDVKKWNYVTPEYLEQVHEGDPIGNARDLAEAYQSSLRKYRKLNREKIELWKAIRKRLEEAYEQHGETGEITKFDPNLIRKKLGVDCPEEYYAEVTEVSDDVSEGLADQFSYDPTRWWHSLGLNLDSLKQDVLEKIFPFLKKPDTSKSAGQLADKVPMDEAWKNPASEFIRFGRKVLVLEAAIEVCAEELRDYVLYGGGQKYGIDGDRTYDEVRGALGKHAFKGDISIQVSRYLIEAPPPSPFLAKLTLKADYNTQMDIVRFVTRDLEQSYPGRDFLRRAVGEVAPWKADPDVDSFSEMYNLNDGPQYTWVENSNVNKQDIKNFEMTIGQHMGFNLVSFIDDPDRSNSRAAKPGKHQRKWGQFEWMRWSSERGVFDIPAPKGSGTVFRWKNRKDPPGANACTKKDWKIKSNSRGKKLARIVCQVLNGAGQLLGANATVKGGDPSPTMSNTTVEDKDVRRNAGVALGASLQTTVKSVSSFSFGVSGGLVGYFETQAEKADLPAEKLRADMNSVGVATAGLVMAGAYSLMWVLETSGDGEISMTGWTEIAAVSVTGFGMVEDMAGGLSKVSGMAVEEVMRVLDGASIVLEVVLAFHDARDATRVMEMGNNKRATFMFGSIGAGLASLIVGVVSSGIGTPLGIVGVALAGVALTFSLVANSVYEAWSALEKWLMHTTFGKQFGQETAQSQPYYGFENDSSRQVSRFQSIQTAGTVETCWVADESRYKMPNDFRFKLSGLETFDGEAEVLICASPREEVVHMADPQEDKGALPGYAEQLFPLFRFKLGWDKKTAKQTKMPNGLQFDKHNSVSLDKYSYSSGNKGHEFTVWCSLGAGQDTKENFRKYFLSPPARDHHKKNPNHPVRDWGWEVLLFPNTTATFSDNLSSLHTTSGKAAEREQLFSLTVPRLRIQMAHQSDNQWEFDNQYGWGNKPARFS